MKTLLTLMLSPLYFISFVLGFVSVPICRGFLDGFLFLQHKEQERINQILKEEMEIRGIKPANEEDDEDE